MYCTAPNGSAYNQTLLCVETKGTNFSGSLDTGPPTSTGTVSVRLTSVLLSTMILGVMLAGL